MNDAQIATLKVALFAETDASVVAWRAANETGLIAAWYSAESPDYYVWRSTTPVADIMDAINWQNLTPADAPDGTQTWMNRSLACQGKQFNVQTMLFRDSVNTSKANVRAGLQDALTNIPSAAGGVAQSAGWVSVKAAITRKATRAEKVFATGAGTQATPATLTYEGGASNEDIVRALHS